MQELDDNALLREYIERDSEEAFAALVTRHVNKVYSVALRLTGNPHSAEEITQAVFVILARKSRQLGKRVIISGWLYQTARLTAVTFIRGGIRRAHREQEACMQTALNENESNTWMHIAPLLDAAMAGLNEADRHAVVLRFFDGKSLREVGAALGANEEAAKKRVSRALEKLRSFFARRGVSSTTAIIAGAISANSVQAAPPVLAKSVAAAALAKGAAVSSSTITLIKGALKVMAWAKVKTAIVVGMGVLLATGTTAIAVKEIQKHIHTTYSWQVPKASFDVLHKTPPQVVIVPTIFSEDGGRVGENDRVLGIAQPIQEIVQAAYRKSKYRTFVATDFSDAKYDFIANLPNGHGSGKALQEELKRKLNVIGRLEQRETDVLLLKIANSHVDGFKPSGSLRQGAPQAKGMRTAMISGLGQYTGFEQPVSVLAFFLESRFGLPVVDRTGLNKSYDFSLKWDEKDRYHLNSDGLQQALLNQLGLELVPSREPIEMLVVEKVK